MTRAEDQLLPFHLVGGQFKDVQTACKKKRLSFQLSLTIDRRSTLLIAYAVCRAASDSLANSEAFTPH
jgi:hypothetical protein